ncbi:hypothetical protein OAP14_07195 [Aliiglaciecola sp.]|nr:hypothetical protein [Aliiglaciecola sp.]
MKRITNQYGKAENPVVLGIGVGLAIGVALGVALDNIGLGIGAGIAICAGIATTQSKKKDDIDSKE